MTDLLLFIENQQVDVSKEFSALLTFAIDDLTNFGSRTTTYSKTIILPGSQRNNRVFGNIWDVNNYIDTEDGPNVLSNFNPSVEARCIMFKGNLQCFKGVIRVMKIVVTDGIPEYECAVFGELGGLVAAFAAKKLEDLDFSEYIHDYTVANISASWGNAKGSGYHYPLLDYANTSANKTDWDLRTFRPCFYVREYLDKSFKDAGYTWESDLFDSALFKSIILSATRKENDLQDITRALDCDLQQTRNTRGFYGDGITSFIRLINTRVSYVNITQLSQQTNYTWPHSGTFTITHNLSATFIVSNFSGVEGSVFLRIIRDTGTIIEQFDSAPIIIDQFVSNGNYVVPFNVNTTAQQGDVFNVGFVMSSNVEPSFSISGTYTIDSNPGFSSVIQLGQQIDPQFFIPQNILQRDLLASIVKMFNLYVYESPDKLRHLIIKPYSEFWNAGQGTDLSLLLWNNTDYLLLNDAGDRLILSDGGINFVDWSNKINRRKPYTIIPMGELNSRYYNYKFQEDSDFYNEQYQKKYNETYGNRIVDVGLQFAKGESDIEVIFGASPLVQYPDRDKHVVPVYKKSNANSVEDAIDGKVRILLTKQLDCTNWVIKDGETTISPTYTSYGYAGHLDDPITPSFDLNFGATKEKYYQGTPTGNNLFNVYWSPYLAEISSDDSIVVEMFAYLQDSDIQQLDFSKFVYIDGNLFRLMKIEDWNASEPIETKITLLRVIQTQY